MPAKNIWQRFTKSQRDTGKNKMPEIIADNISVINSDALEGATRLDAEYYQPIYLRTVKLIGNMKTLRMYLEEIIHPTEIKRIYSEKGIQILLAQNIENNRLNFNINVFMEISKKDALKRNRLKYSDVCMTRSGANFGDAASYLGVPTNIYACADCLILRPREIEGSYIATFLNTKYGKYLLERGAYGMAQPHIAPNYLYDIKLPYFSLKFETEIKNIIEKSHEFFEKSRISYSNAETLLLKVLDIKEIDLSHEPCYEVSSAETISASRIDAEYYQPKYERVVAAIKKHPHKSVGEMFRLIKGVEPGSSAYCEEGMPFIRVSNLNKFEINSDNQQYLSAKIYAELKANYRPFKGEILLSKDATPGIVYHLKESIDGIISSGILRLQALTDIKKEYICLVINSLVGQSQIERDSGGSVIKHWKPSQVQKTLIPILPDKIQEKIELLCLESHSVRRQAKGLLEEAKKKVEDMIEKGQDD